MEKINFDFSNFGEIKFRTIKIGENKIKIENMISFEKYEKIINDIRETILYNPSISDKYILLQARYVKNVLDLCTNIDTTDINVEYLMFPQLTDILSKNILNFEYIKECLIKEYEKWVFENCFNILGGKMPTASEMEKSVKKISEMIDNLPKDKLEIIGKSIVWNNMPALGKQVAPAEYKPVSAEA